MVIAAVGLAVLVLDPSFGLADRPLYGAREMRAAVDEGVQWTVVNPHHRNRLGYPTGYLLDVHSERSRVLMSDDDFPLQRAQFVTHNLWVTQFDNTELYAAGNFPNQSLGGDGLPQ